MLAKLKLSKICLKIIFLVTVSFVVVACGEKEVMFNTEILCPDGSRVLVKFASLDEVRLAIVKNYEDKKKNGTSDKDTVLRLSSKRSFRIEKIAPEKIIKCSLKESFVGEVERSYWRRFRAY